jgi:hypothetical protein
MHLLRHMLATTTQRGTETRYTILPAMPSEEITGTPRRTLSRHQSACDVATYPQFHAGTVRLA